MKGKNRKPDIWGTTLQPAVHFLPQTTEDYFLDQEAGSPKEDNEKKTSIKSIAVHIRLP